MLAWVKGIAVLLIALGLFGGGFYVGRMKPALAAARATIQRDAENQKQESIDAARINQEAHQMGQAPLDPIAAPVVRLQYVAAPASVPGAAAARPIAHGSPDIPAGHPVDPLPGPDVGRPLVLVGHEADAQVAALQDYITHVCRVKAP
jgi:hypothetical protein